METFKVKYVHGQFIEVNTGRRIIPNQNAEYILTGQAVDFKKEDEKLSVSEALSSEKMKEWISKKFEEGKYIKFLGSGKQLFSG